MMKKRMKDEGGRMKKVPAKRGNDKKLRPIVTFSLWRSFISFPRLAGTFFILPPSSFILFFFIFALACSCQSKDQKPKSSDKPSAATPTRAANPANTRVIPVKAATVLRQDFPVYLSSVGTVYSIASIDIRPQVVGKLLEEYAKEGQMVNQGDLLYTIDPAPYQATLDKANAALKKDEAQLKFALQTLERYNALIKQNYVSQSSIEQYQQNVDAAQALVDIDKADITAAEINVGYCSIYSPIRGKVGRFMVDPGNIVSTDSILTNVQQLSPISVQFTLTQDSFREIQSRDSYDKIKCDILLDDSKDAPLVGDLYFVDNHIDLKSGTILLKCRVANRDEKLWPGEFVRVRILAWTKPDAMIVPLSAVLKGQNGEYVYRITTDNTVEVVNVTAHEKSGGQIVIEGDLQAGDQVVTEGQMNLRSGAKVTISTDPTSDAKK